MMRFIVPLCALLAMPAVADTRVAVETTLGNFEIALFDDKAPKSVENFLTYVEDGSYVGTQFHRVIPEFVVQGGGFDEKMNRLPVYGEIDNESKNGLSNERGTLAMARTSAPHSANRQFYINLNNNGFLDGAPNKYGYTVFGKVTKGFATFEKIAQQPTVTLPAKRMQDVPQQPIVITSMAVIAQ